MKLKEQLASEQERIYGRLSCCSEASYEAYIAGFEKAREMAVEELKGGTGDAAGLDEVIATLGEEDVPDDTRT